MTKAQILERAKPPSRAPALGPEWLSESVEDDLFDLSVCIVNWNCRDMLRACLESLRQQAHDLRMETIVVDNASADGAAEMVAEEFPEVTLERNATNVGFARANNQAARLSRGRYLFFLNNDTLIPAGALRRLVEYAETHPEAGIVGPRLRDGNGQTQVSYRQRPTLGTLLHRTSLLRWTGLLRSSYLRYRRQEFDPTVTRRVDVLMGAAMLLPRKTFLHCGGWDEEFIFGGEDMELSARIGRLHHVVYHPEVEITHYGRVSTRQHIGYCSSNMAIGFHRYLRKTGCPWPGLILYKTIVTLDTPIQVVGKGLQYLWRKAKRRDVKAAKSLLAMKGSIHFLCRGLVPFWLA
jgi:GT2 family glycosyltransferase